jgi:hypothetical protein
MHDLSLRTRRSRPRSRADPAQSHRLTAGRNANNNLTDCTLAKQYALGAQRRTRIERSSSTPGTLSSVPCVTERASDPLLARATDSIPGAPRRTRIKYTRVDPAQRDRLTANKSAEEQSEDPTLARPSDSGRVAPNTDQCSDRKEDGPFTTLARCRRLPALQHRNLR